MTVNIYVLEGSDDGIVSACHSQKQVLTEALEYLGECDLEQTRIIHRGRIEIPDKDMVTFRLKSGKRLTLTHDDLEVTIHRFVSE